MSDRKQAKRTMRIMLALLLILVLGTIAFGSYICTYDHTQRQYVSGQDCDAFTVSVAARTGQTDSWPKQLEENGETVTYRGAIYDVTLNNIGSNVISRWSLRINIDRELYLNNAWCGTFEIHQNVNGQEKVQTIDLRDYDPAELHLDYLIADPDLLIPLHPGDYLIYWPDFASNEYPIPYGDSDKLTRVVFGAIFYDNLDQPLEFDDLSMSYYLQTNWVSNPIFWILSLGFLAWFVALISFASVEVNMKKAHVRFEQDEGIIRQSIGVFTHFFEAKDIYTNGHSQRVADYSRLIAEKLGVTGDQLRQDYYIALMHDCGKCYIPDEILKKPGKLTRDEYEIIKTHTVKGAEMLEDFQAIEHMKDGVLYHHERYDGGGYPAGLAGEEIPLIARIICIADSFDAMNSRRCYRDMLTRDYIIDELTKNKGKQFDPHLADLFLELIGEGKISFNSDAK